ncbi:NAD(P)H-dependent glycerol-3-phosphate dehydrogenase [Rhodoligotrophos defluvii]|uniref:NAD(P)H-dependent glycerol-3-phosphate dehydrogenase n=1 Tax=Rhodoligotrophos defluvii TaxID=2561934 RepID=UPI0010C978C7|nr:NAD(P)H-dependent glycerol-3-phosphate dehydrogenase [Rhodoligotrophos defluvii]
MSGAVARIGIIGAGAWGTALACLARQAGVDVVLWAREPEVIDAINKQHENTLFLPGIALDRGILATGDLAEAAQADILLLVCPAQALRSVGQDMAAHVGPDTPVAICAKGLERGTHKLMTEVLAEVLPQAEPMVLSGPSFAADVARGLPTAVTLAARTHDRALAVAATLAGPTFRPYIGTDLIGAQIGGAVKNVLAIACGIVEGRKLGDSARASLMTRAFAELTRFGRSFGAHAKTLAGLSGLGDLILTCSSLQSRNMSLGYAIGEGRSVDEVLGERRSVSEGVYTAGVVVELAEQRGIDMPIARAVHGIVEGRLTVQQAIEDLFNRPLKAEFEPG